MNAIQTIERAAIQAHQTGQTWQTFHRKHSSDINRAEPVDHRAYHRLVCHLLALVVSGDTDGQQPVDNDDAMPWLSDDQPSPSDTETEARC